ncbi:MAG: hypothetical protein NZM27_02755 [Acetobacteraceae bacterium]|nr:hypothetical protein [Acetobacteraceae bacterium]MDW8397506.1 hypothetical protein [Acetobacteraceae bacterium]
MTGDAGRRRATPLGLHELARERLPGLFLMQQVDVTGASPRALGFRQGTRGMLHAGATLG